MSCLNVNNETKGIIKTIYDIMKEIKYVMKNINETIRLLFLEILKAKKIFLFKIKNVYRRLIFFFYILS